MAWHLVLRCRRYFPLLERHDVFDNQADKLKVLLTVNSQVELFGEPFQVQVLEAGFQQPVSKQKVGHQLDPFLRIKLLLWHEFLHGFLVEQLAKLANAVRNHGDFFEQLLHDCFGDVHQR